MNILIEKMGKDQDKFLLNISKGEEIWCCEKRLGNILDQLFPNHLIMYNNQIILESKKFRPDYNISEKKIVVEFNGFHHFCDPKVIYNDYIKKMILERNGWKIIEIPYFVQLTKNVTKYLFCDFVESDLIQDFSRNFPHGFIHPKSGSLGIFCILGLEKAENIFKDFPKEVKEQCFKSLKKRSMIDNIPLEYYNPLKQKGEQ